jgi:hypothetical protein
MASATETTKQLFRTLQEMNRTRMDPQTRIQLAELLCEPIAYVVGEMAPRYTGSSFPLSEKSLRAAHVCTRMYEELGYAYKIAVHDMAQVRIGTQERNLLVVALFRAVRRLADMVYLTALVYEPFPRHIWRELHNLFAFAETNKWSATKVKIRGGEPADSPASTLRESYVQALLFAMSSPHRLRQREIHVLLRRLPEWAPLVRMSGYTGNPGDTRFVVRLKRDEPPTHSSLLSGPVEKPALELDTGALIQALHRLFDTLPPDTAAMVPGNHQDDVGRPLLRRLIQAWGTAPRRQFVRTQLNFDLDIAVGLSNVYTLISGDDDTDRGIAHFGTETDDSLDTPELNVESTFSSDLLESDSGLTLVPMDDRNDLHPGANERLALVTHKEKAPAPPIWAREVESEPETSATTTLRTLNESAGGYCVHWHGHRVPGIQIGELVGIQSSGGSNSYGLAVVRWMQNTPETGLQIGMQLLASNAYAVSVTEAERRRRTPAHCLLVPELKSADRPASLVMPTLGFTVGMSLDVRHGDTEQRVRLVRLLEATGAFAQFQFQYE